MILVGTSLRFLQDVDVAWSPNSPGGVVENYRAMVTAAEDAGLNVTARALGIALGDLMDRLASSADPYTLTVEDVDAIQTEMKAVRLTISAEGEASVLFAASEGRYDAQRLLNRIESYLASGTYGRLSDVAALDFQEAGRCLVFGVPTAAAFHMLRCTEDVLRKYYLSWIRRNRMNVLLWGPMVTALRAARNGPDGTVLDHLDHVRLNFRNPTDHPEKIYDQTEADDLFGLCIEVINRMSRTMRTS